MNTTLARVERLLEANGIRIYDNADEGVEQLIEQRNHLLATLKTVQTTFDYINGQPILVSELKRVVNEAIATVTE